MRFSDFGGYIQTGPGAEGFVLIQAGLLTARCGRDAVEVDATEDLRELFDPMPELEHLYPVLVEYVMNHRQERAGFLVGNRPQTDRRLRRLGMTEAGLGRLKCRVAAAARP